MLMVGRNNLLLLDEPTNNLDPPSRQSVADALNDVEGHDRLRQPRHRVRRAAEADQGAADARRPGRLLQRGLARARLVGVSPMDLQGLVDLETTVWDALVRGDADADARLLSADFLGVYSSGFAGRADHAGQLAAGPTIAAFRLLEARMVELSDEHVLLSYRAEYQRLVGGVAQPSESMYVSSLWSRRSGEWVNVFSQDTPAG